MDSDEEGDEGVAMDTMIDETPVVTEMWDRANDLHVAPGEGRHPLGWYHDTHALALSYPTIFGVHAIPEYKNRQANKKISFMAIARWMFRNKDTRAARNTSFPFRVLRLIHTTHLLGCAHMKIA